jgi:PilZ domain
LTLTLAIISAHISYATFTEGLAPDVDANWLFRKANAPVELAVVLSRAHKKLFKERVVTENVSSHGLGVVTKSVWPPGTRILVSFAGENIDEQARVVYCQRLTKGKFAVGIHFSTKV